MPLIAPPLPAKDVAILQVFRGEQAVGSLVRTLDGSRFTYDPEFARLHSGDPGRCVAYAMPVRAQAYSFPGASLPPFFAGLLPEGLRYQALVRGLDVPSHDQFSVLTAVGRNPVGDVWVQPEGSATSEGLARLDYKELGKHTFAELQALGLKGESPADPIALSGIGPKLSVGVVNHPLRARSHRRESFLKLTSSLFPRLAENEAFFMAMASSLKMQTAQVRVVQDAGGKTALLVQRFDRVQTTSDNQQPLTRLHQEDACQLLGRDPSHKFSITPADVSNALAVCTAPMVERLKFFQLYALSYLIGNGNLHGKNIAVQSAQGRTHLAPIYDLHSTLPYGVGNMALSIGERGAPLTRKALVDYAERCGVRRRATERMLDSLIKGATPWIPRLPEIGLAERHTRRLGEMMLERLVHLSRAQ